MSTGTYFRRKQGLVIQLVLNPRHQIVNVLGSRALDRLLNVGPICPMILVSEGKEMSEAETDGPSHSSLSKHTHFGPADMTGQLSSEQKSVMVPYSMLIWLKKSTAAGTTKQKHGIFH